MSDAGKRLVDEHSLRKSDGECRTGDLYESQCRMSKEKIQVAVVIPAYNCADKIAAAIESVLQQTYPANEIVVVDDGSTDQTADVLKELSESIAKLRFVSQVNGGPAKARNTGIELVKSEWIAFLDADDQWLPHRLQRQVELIEENAEVKWLAGAYRRVRYGEAGRTELGVSDVSVDLQSVPDGVYPALPTLAGSTSIWTGTILAATSALKQLGGFSTELFGCEDSDLWTRLAIEFPHLGFVSEPIAVYTVAQSSSVTGQNSRLVDPSRYQQFRRIVEYIDHQTDRETGHLLSLLLKRKIEGCMSGLLRSGNTTLARAFVNELRSQQLPLPSFLRRVLSFIPDSLARAFRNQYQSLRSRGKEKIG